MLNNSKFMNKRTVIALVVAGIGISLYAGKYAYEAWRYQQESVEMQSRLGSLPKRPSSALTSKPTGTAPEESGSNADLALQEIPLDQLHAAQSETKAASAATSLPISTSSLPVHSGPQEQAPSLSQTRGQILGEQARLQYELDILKLQTAIAEQNKKLSTINAPTPPTPLVTAGPSISELMAMLQEQKNSEAIGTPAVQTAQTPTIPVDVAPGRIPRMVSFQEAGGKPTAIVLLGDGEHLAQVGGSLSGSKVAKITREQVVLQSGKKIGW